jgi:hypothetical protein
MKKVGSFFAAFKWGEIEFLETLLLKFMHFGDICQYTC